ncbi:hypothetical protein BEP19_16285 [Ammoniphilus oxalaticus]|uniref:Sporulation protein n=1 Tax=Ammoniphilus oxalaticus TaxID=66863 RepID=A0A419SQS8_9BACL|nr:YhcN/YlaJ family sporulation lipoprotein [Ammoniphilus oxalaticus]RKD26757.1 hypothetical protein BEP19_16285 [Ammoniphilus oxalaticus]
MSRLKKRFPQGFILLFIACFSILTACQSSTIQETTPAQTDYSHSIQKIKFKLSDTSQAQKISRQIKGVDRAVAVVIDQDVSVALEVSGFDRLRLQTIRKETHQQLSRKMKGPYTFHITTDKKLYQSLKTLQSELINATKSGTELENRFNKIKEDMHG